VVVDRNVVLKKAENLLREGKLDQAAEVYVWLVELRVDISLDSTLRDGKAQLADAYLQEDRGVGGRAISEALLDHDPGSEAHIGRLVRGQIWSPDR